MKHWRVTKYDPAFRDSSGAYRRDEWTSFEDIGRSFGGTILTMSEYKKIEDRYVNAATHFLHAAGVGELIALDIEQRTQHGPPLAEGMEVNIDALPTVVRAILRGQVWCKLELRPLFYLHFGYDYYMYIGCQQDLPESVRTSIGSGLFVEDEMSPYLQWD